jgi:serine/threonine protein kinase
VLESFILSIREHFKQNTQSIHKARNELKIIRESETDIVVKSFNVPNIVRRIVYTFFRDSKAKKSYEYSLKIGDFTPEPIGYIEFYQQKLLADSYFLAKKFEYDFTIREPLLKDTFQDKEIILKAFASFTYDLHQKGILHQDYSPGNILIKKENNQYNFKIVDINRMEFRELNINERLKNFAKLWISDEDLRIVAYQYAVLLGEDQEKCYQIALGYSHTLKNKVNMKKRLKGIEVVD